MKIDSSFQTLQPQNREIISARPSGTPSGNESGAAALPATGAVGHRDETHLSSAALGASASAALPEVRTEKVAGIQQALASGTYEVSSLDVADKLIGHLLQVQG
jgi:negative regulator of flagellin synthesis FlgM